MKAIKKSSVFNRCKMSSRQALLFSLEIRSTDFIGMILISKNAVKNYMIATSSNSKLY